MEVDLDVTDAPDKAVSTDVSTQNEKQIECVTTNNAIDLAHNSPITEASAFGGWESLQNGGGLIFEEWVASYEVATSQKVQLERQLER